MNMFNQNFQEEMRKLQTNPQEFFQKKGVNVPAEIMNNPQAVVMHLIQTGQVSSPMLQRIMPMMQQMNTIR